MPALSSTMTEGKIVEWLKQPGDKVERGESVLVVESDKADMDVESFNEGYLAAVLMPAGGTAPVGETIGLIVETEAEIAEVAAKAPAAPAVSPDPAPAAAAPSLPVTPPPAPATAPAPAIAVAAPVVAPASTASGRVRRVQVQQLGQGRQQVPLGPWLPPRQSQPRFRQSGQLFRPPAPCRRQASTQPPGSPR